MKKRLASLTLISLLVLCLPCASPAHAQVGDVTGRAVSSDGSPLPGVTVALAVTPTPWVTVTDSLGRFRFIGVPTGTYAIRAELEGFAVKESLLTSNPGRTTEIEITLELTALEDVITVTGADSGGFEAAIAGQDREEPMVFAGPEGESVFDRVAPPPATPSQPAPAPKHSAAFAARVPPSAAEATLPRPVVAPPDGTSFVQMKVFYGTDRLPTGSRLPAKYFGKGRSYRGELHFGVCRVTIPHLHHPGEIERPAIWKIFVHPNPAKDLTIAGIDPLAQPTFFERLARALETTKKREVLVFIHGYNVPFVDAALRTAQLAHDLDLDGVPVLYSWPSQASLLGYPADEDNAEWTIPHLEAFLGDIAGQSGATAIYVIAHSLGNRPLTSALKDIAVKLGDNARPPFQEILLTAPDIDAGVFADLAHAFRKAAERVTLYASSKDYALFVSKKFSTHPRAGDAGPNIVVIPDVDTVDVSEVKTDLLGHSTFADSCSVLKDISRLLREHAPPQQRGLDERQKDGRPYWVVHAAPECVQARGEHRPAG